MPSAPVIALLEVSVCVVLADPPSHSTTVPTLVCQAMSGVPSPLTSPIPANVQPAPAVPSVAVALTDAPFMYQTDTTPVVVFSHTTSAMPSRLKSPVPSTVQVDAPTISGADAGASPPTTLNPFMYVSHVAPVVGFQYSRSALPSPLKSPPAGSIQPPDVVLVTIIWLPGLLTCTGNPNRLPVTVLYTTKSLVPLPYRSPLPTTRQLEPAPKLPHDVDPPAPFAPADQ